MRVGFLQTLCFVLTAGLLSACNLSSVTDSNPSGTTVGGMSAALVSVGVDTLESVPENQWITDTNRNIYTSTNKLSVKGKCTRGIASVNLYLNGVIEGSAKCNLAGKFSWSDTKTYPDGSYPVRITPVAGDGKEYTGKDWYRTVIIDTSVPAAPVITSPTHTVITTGSFTVTGTVSSANTFKVVSNDSTGTYSFSYPGFSFSYQMTPGETKTYTFYAKSRSGLSSPPVSITICYLATASLVSFDTTGAAISTPLPDTSGSPKTFSTINSSPYLMATEPKQSSDGRKLFTGVLHYVH